MILLTDVTQLVFLWYVRNAKTQMDIFGNVHSVTLFVTAPKTVRKFIGRKFIDLFVDPSHKLKMRLLFQFVENVWPRHRERL